MKDDHVLIAFGVMVAGVALFWWAVRDPEEIKAERKEKETEDEKAEWEKSLENLRGKKLRNARFRCERCGGHGPFKVDWIQPPALEGVLGDC